jgi:ubiquinone/menaquinone biosynthesis C-methylase UbiE
MWGNTPPVVSAAREPSPPRLAFSNSVTRPVSQSASAEYDEYVRAEWELFAKDPARWEEAARVSASLPIARVLDIGCGAGQELRPFVANRRTFGVGIDKSPYIGRAGRELFAREDPGGRIAFTRATAERMPFGDGAFDLIICRLALPYMDNATALQEMSRVLRPGGALLLKIHHARYYTRQFRQAVSSLRWKSAINACLILATGTWYHASGTQPHGWLVGGETFQTLWMLKRELARRGMEIERRLADSSPASPSLFIRKRPITSTGPGAPVSTNSR